jgi:hypothetical protein
MVCHFCAISIICCLIKGSRVCSARSSHSRALARYSSAFWMSDRPPSVRYITNVNYEVVAGHLLPRAQRPAGFIAQPAWRSLCRIAKCYGSSPAGAGPSVAPPLRHRERAPSCAMAKVAAGFADRPRNLGLNITAARIGLRGTVPTRTALSRPRRCHRVPQPPTTTRSPASRNCVPDSDAAAPGQTGRHRQDCETRCRPSTGSAAPAAPSSLGLEGSAGLGRGLRLLAMECADGQSLRNTPKSG